MTEPSKKKKRTSLVCSNCRRKKVKCDRGQPCDQCVKANKSNSCTYEDIALAVNAADVKHAPYYDCAKRPIRFNNVVTEESKENMHRSHSAKTKQKVASTTESELDFLRNRLQIIEQSLELNRQNLLPLYQDSTPYNHPQRSNEAPLPILFPRNSLKPDAGFSPLNYLMQSQTVLPPMPNQPIPTQPMPNQPIPTQPMPNKPIPNQSNTSQKVPEYSVGGVTQALPQNSPPITAPFSYGSNTTPSTHVTDATGYTPINTSSITTGITTNISESPYSSSSTNSPAQQGPKNLCGVNPVGSPDDTLNFYEGYCTVHTKDEYQRLNFGPFCWSSLMQKDGALKILWDHCTRTRETSAKAAIVFANKDITAEVTTLLTTDTKDNSINLDEKVFEKRSLETEGIDNLLPYYKKKKTIAEKNLQESQQNTQRLSLGLAYCDGKIETELRLIDKIKLFLPKKKVIWKLIKIFFSDVYPFTPLLEELSFRKEISKIIGPEEYKDEKIVDINIERRLDLAFIGILLIIIRLSYISLFSNRSDINLSRINDADTSASEKAYKYLLSNPITINLVSIAEECLNQFDMFRYPSFPILQLALFSKIYHTYAPEDGDGADGGGAAGMMALLTQMATNLGCNREPDNLPNFDHRTPRNNLSRRIWHILVLNDIHLGCSFGNPINITRGSYDTKIPFYKEGEECLGDKELDKFVNESLFSNTVIYLPIRNILHLALNIEGKVRIAELNRQLSSFELLVRKEYGDLGECLNPVALRYQDFCIATRTKFYMSVKSFCCVIYFYLYLYYESRNVELSFFYFKKIFLVIVSELMPHYFKLIGELKHSMVVNPSIEQAINTSNHMLFSMLIRCNYFIHDLKNQPNHNERCKDPKYLRYFKTKCKLSSSLTKCLEVSVAAISKISNRYYYAWRITKGHTFMLKTITESQFYETNHEQGKPFCRTIFTVEQLEEVVNLCDETLNRLGKENSNFRFSPEDIGEFMTHSKLSKQEPQTPALEKEKDEVIPKLYSNFGTTPKAQEPNALPMGSPEPGDSVKYDLDFFNSTEIDKLWLQMFDAGEQLESNLDMFNTGMFDNAFSNP